MIPALLHPGWDAPARVRAAVTLRHPGYSVGPYAGMNLGYHTGDAPTAVAANREALTARIGIEHVRWLEQVHGARVVEATVDSLHLDVEADGAVTSVPGLACAVMVADCLPVLLATRSGERVGALHVGWRGLLAGVLDAGVARMGGSELTAWLGPCISGEVYEVGPEVRAAYLDAGHADARDCAFTPSPGRREHWLLDLRAVARARLRALGVSCAASRSCVHGRPQRFYSYRRDGVTGRFAALVWIE